MKRLLVPLAVVLALAGQSAAAAVLRDNMVVDGDLIHLSDLFDDLGDHPDIAVTRAPLPGKRLVLSAEWLNRIAAANRLNWHPSSAYDQITVERRGQTVSREQIQGELLEALAGQGLPANAQIELNGTIDITVPGNVPPTLAVRDVTYDGANKHFSATIETPADSPSAQRIRVSGRVFVMVDVPVLAHAVNHNDVIGSRDLTFQRVREDTLRRDIVTDPDQVIGLAARQSLRSGETLSSSNFQRPIAVQRDGLVTVVLRSGGMSLTTQGKALEAGSVGDTIHVLNTHSKQTLEGKVEGPSLVSVPLAGDDSAPAN